MKRTAAVKRVWLALAIGVAVVVFAALLWNWTPKASPQIITLPGGQQYQLTGATYGTNEFWGTPAARLIHRLPASLAHRIEKRLGKRLGEQHLLVTKELTLWVWFRRVGTNGVISQDTFAALAGDRDGKAGSETIRISHNVGSFRFGGITAPGSAANNDFAVGPFQVVPRRSPVLQLQIFDAANQEIGRVRFANPAYGHFPQWKPEPVPAVKMAGDVEIRLDNFQTGVQISSAPVVLASGALAMRYRPAQKGENAESVIDISRISSLRSNEVWVVHSAELSDATGNRLSLPPGPLYLSGLGQHTLRGTLWPDETSWRLKVELKRKSGFSPAEVVTFKKIPTSNLRTTNSPLVTNMVGGIPVVLKDFAPTTGVRGKGVGGLNTLKDLVRFELPGRPAGVALNFVDLTTNTGEKPGKYFEEAGVDNCVVYLDSIPTNVSSLDFTLVVQKTRTVEFMVKPPGGK